MKDEDPEKEWFDKIIRQAAWPSLPHSFELLMVERARQYSERRAFNRNIISERSMARERTLLVTALFLLFCLGAAARGWINPDLEGFSHNAYYTGPGLYMAEQYSS